MYGDNKIFLLLVTVEFMLRLEDKIVVSIFL